MMPLILDIAGVMSGLTKLEDALARGGKTGGEKFAVGVAAGVGSLADKVSQSFGQSFANTPTFASFGGAAQMATSDAKFGAASAIAGAIPIAGPALQGMVEKYRKDYNTLAYQPMDTAVGNIQNVAGRMAGAGIQIGDDEIDGAYQFQIAMQRRVVLMNQRIAQRAYSSGNVMDSQSFAASHIMGH